MKIKLLAFIFLVILLAGCATGRKGQNLQIQNLQNRIDCLEAELKTKNQQISSLKNEVERKSVSSLKPNLQEDKALEWKMSTKQIQRALKNAGSYQGSVDGKFGQKTKEAIKAFQKANGLRVDGIVGKQTALKLKNYLY